MPVNYMDRLAALRGDRSHAAGASSHARSAPVLHADEKSKSKRKKRRKPLSRKQKAALAKGRRVMAQRRSEKKMGKRKKSRKSSSRKSPRRKRGYKSAAARRTKAVGAFHIRAHRAGKRVRKRKSKGVTTYTFAPKRKRRKAPKRHKSHKRSRKRKSVMAHRKSPKRAAAGRKAARTRKRHKAERAAARKRGGRKHKRHSKKRHYKRRAKHRRAAPRRRRRGGRARRRARGYVKRNNRTGKFVGRGGRSRRSHVIHYGASRKRGAYHKAGRISRESYSMENPLDGGELATGLGAGLLGFIAADVADRMIAGKGPLGGLPAAESAPIYSDYMRLGAGLGMAILPLAGAHFINGAKHRHIRAALQFFGFGAGIRTLGHLFTDLVVGQLKANATVGPTVQALYPQEIIAAGQAAGAKAAGAGALPEQIGEAMRGLGALPQGVAACCNNSSRLLNTALSPLQPIGRSAESGQFAPTPQASLPPPIERIVQQPYSPPAFSPPGRTVTQRTVPAQPAIPAQPGFPGQPAVPATTVTTVQAPAAASMVAAYAPISAMPQAAAGVNGLPLGPFGWGDDNP